MRWFVWKIFAGAVIAFAAGCGGEAALRRTVQRVGAESLRTEVLEACREGFAAKTPQKISDERWPGTARAFKPMGMWAEPDGAYLLLDSDADGERGIFIPRILSETDPVCGPALTHKKLAAGVYSYDRKR